MMRKLLFIIVLFFSTSSLSNNHGWKYFTDNKHNNLRFWISEGFEIAHTNISIRNSKLQDYVHTLVNKDKPEYAVMCLVTLLDGEPHHTVCYREVY